MKSEERAQWLAKYDVTPFDAIMVSLPEDPERQLFSVTPASFLLYSDALYPLCVVRKCEDGVVHFVEAKQ